jgi:dipeptidyl-peptidase 4
MKSNIYRHFSLISLICWLYLVAFQSTACSQLATEFSHLSVERIFEKHEFSEEKISDIRWSKIAPVYFTLAASTDKQPGRDLIKVELVTGNQTTVVASNAFTPAERSEPLKVEAFDLSPDESKVLIYTNSKRVWRKNTRGDYWLMDLATQKLVKLGGDVNPSTLMFCKFSPDGMYVAYVYQNNLFVQELSSLSITALTTDGSATLINGTSDWVNEEELGIRDGFRWSPDSNSIVFWQFDTSGVRQFHLLNNTDGTYPKIISFPYPKVGEKNSSTRLGVVKLSGEPVRWLEIPGDSREHYLPHAEWTPDGSQLLVQQFNRLQTENRVMLADPISGKTRSVFTESDGAWLENDNPVRWLNNGKELLWVSERDGWRHAYIAGLDGKRFDHTTKGAFDLMEAEAIDKTGGWLYYSASPENATQRYLYRTRLEGGSPKRLSPKEQSGWHTYNFSPDTQWAIHTYSNFATPPVVELVRMPDHQVVRVLENNRKLRDKIALLDQTATELFKVDIGEGLTLDAWCIKPPGIDLAATAKYPLLIHVYGEPHGQTVKDQWGGQRSMWHRMLAQQGCVVASFDNRGTNVPRGREWRKSVHRKIGIIASQEQAAATRELLKRWSHIDPNRVGVWGWSGGGSMSLNAVFRYPELYHTAIAVAPNANQLLYDSIYQERYMGLPTDNADNYRDGSPIKYARNLQGNLLLVHGTGDDNGHFQGTEMLMNELIALGKHFTVMPYPNRSHAISEGTNTTPHFWGLLTRYLHDNLISEAAATKFDNRKFEDKAANSTKKEAAIYETRTILGWTVHINPELLSDSPEATARALVLLEKQLDEIIRVVPEKAVVELKKVPLYFSPTYGGKRGGAEFHPDAGWLRNNGRDPNMAKGVEFSNINKFEEEMNRMPNFALHELAHAYHNRFLHKSFSNPEIEKAFNKAKTSGKYDRIERWYGNGKPNTFEKSYAMTNPMEYFAECTEAFFTRNDFYPFTRDELNRHDPEMFGLLEKLWSAEGDSKSTATQ